MSKNIVKDFAQSSSKYIAKLVNPTLTRVTADASALAGIVYLADQLPDLNSPTLALLTGSATIGLYAIDKALSKLVQKTKHRTSMKSPLLTAIMCSILGVSSYSLADEAVDIYQDLEAIVSKINGSVPTDVDEVKAKEDAKKLPVSRIYKLPDFSSVKLASKGSTIGDVQRTYRWKPIIEAVERKYGIPSGVLGGLIMQESYGDPLQPNGTNDGGIGLIHTQGTTAKILGLDIYADSKSDHDPEHGKKLVQLFEKCDDVVECIAEKDDRAHPLKNLDAIARYMMQGYRAHGNWDAAIQWVRGPGLVNKRTGIKYLSMVKDKRNSFNANIEKAEDDFNKRNVKVNWDTYQDAFHRMCEMNFGLNQYK
jgi:hypothetical protein